MSINFIDTINRIKSLKKLITDSDVAALLGMTKGNLSNYKDRNSIPFEALFSFCEREGISLDWLLTGEGQMRRGEIAVPERVTGVAESAAEYRGTEIIDPHRREAVALIVLASDEDVGLVLRLLKHRAEGREIKKLFKEEG